ncbi:hypothetical protein CZ765_05775 [Corynebacterium casei]|nr:hypothetical protein CZ765_05775 [Corynebacterium casei]
MFTQIIGLLSNVFSGVGEFVNQFSSETFDAIGTLSSNVF